LHTAHYGVKIEPSKHHTTAEQAERKNTMTKLTKKDLTALYYSFTHCRRGYCCYQEDNKSRYELREIGYNRGVYGWNWTVYADDKTDTLYVDSYRNVPACVVNK